ncbi:hypothetical protein V1511DRAFT_486292 [Dipodascopsis uninucleata]
MLTPQDLTRSTYAFISHSPTTYPLREPEIDNPPLARRKRRRTSPNELRILHTEFKRCPKPPRHVRQEIAERVGMSEKAVQIWFQNRRQSCRRAAQANPASIQQSFSSSTTSSPEASPLESEFDITRQLEPKKREDRKKNANTSQPGQSFDKKPSVKGVLTPSKSSITNVSSKASHNSSLNSMTNGTGSISLGNNNASQHTGAASTVSSSVATPTIASRSSSQIRLTMSLDGKAQVVLHQQQSDLISSSEKENYFAIGKTTLNSNTAAVIASSSISIPSISAIAGLTALTASSTPDSEIECVQNLLRLRSGTWN